jgi:hypothetical protein
MPFFFVHFDVFHGTETQQQSIACKEDPRAPREKHYVSAGTPGTEITLTPRRRVSFDQSHDSDLFLINTAADHRTRWFAGSSLTLNSIGIIGAHTMKAFQWLAANCSN